MIKEHEGYGKSDECKGVLCKSCGKCLDCTPHCFEVKNPEVETKLREIGGVIGKELPQGFGFTLFLFEYGEGGSMFYISSAQREDMIKAIMEFLEKQKNG